MKTCIRFLLCWVGVLPLLTVAADSVVVSNSPELKIGSYATMDPLLKKKIESSDIGKVKKFESQPYPYLDGAWSNTAKGYNPKPALDDLRKLVSRKGVLENNTSMRYVVPFPATYSQNFEYLGYFLTGPIEQGKHAAASRLYVDKRTGDSLAIQELDLRVIGGSETIMVEHINASAAGNPATVWFEFVPPIMGQPSEGVWTLTTHSDGISRTFYLGCSLAKSCDRRSFLIDLADKMKR